ncbi:tubby C-terminal-like domain-containing protein [Neocallimastix sp. 'constans']
MMGFYEKDEVCKLSSPKNSIVVIDEKYTYKHPITLVLNEKVSPTGNDFDIESSSGVTYFKCRGKGLSVGNDKVFYDNEKNPLFMIRNKFFSVKKKLNIYEGDRDHKTLGSVIPLSVVDVQKYNVDFLNKTSGEREQFIVKCDTSDGNSASIFYDGGVICKIERKEVSIGTFLSRKSKFTIDIAPGVDTAFILAVAICYDKMKNGK